MPSPTVSQELTAADHLTFIWKRSEVVDLNSPEGTFIRAVTESMERVALTGNVTYAFPGFRELFQSAEAKKRFRDAYSGEYTTNIPYGTIQVDVLTLKRISGDRYAAVICRDDYGLGRKDAAGNWVTSKALPPRPMQIDYSTTGVITPPGAMHGPASTPRGNVFGSWTVDTTRHSGSSDCPRPSDWRTRKDPIDPTTFPPFPGWPA